jgi:hypothetical protein
LLNRSRDRRQTKRDPTGSELLHAPLECATLVMPSANISFTDNLLGRNRQPLRRNKPVADNVHKDVHDCMCTCQAFMGQRIVPKSILK